jgi:hypothetical protein
MSHNHNTVWGFPMVQLQTMKKNKGTQEKICFKW